MKLTPTLLDYATHRIKGVGRAEKGLYYLLNTSIAKLDARFASCSVIISDESYSLGVPSPNTVENALANNCSAQAKSFDIWHHRLGHAPVSKLKHIPCISDHIHVNRNVCVTCCNALKI